MKSYHDRPHSARRVTKEESTDVKRQRAGKDGNTRSEATEHRRDIIVQIRTGLNRIEKRLDRLTEGIEQNLWPDESREDTVGEKSITYDVGELFADLKRIEEKLIKHSTVEDRLVKKYVQQCSEKKKMERTYEEVRMERDVLLEKIHSYLEQISSLKSKIEEQRCSIGAYERQVNAEYEIHLRKLESMNEDLRISAVQKEKQLRDVNEQLRQTQKMLRSYEMLSWRKKNEESVFISILKNDLQTIWNDKMKMEEEFKKLKKKCGYTEENSNWKNLSEEYVGSSLRRSKSLSDLTVEEKSTDPEVTRREIISTSSKTPWQDSENSLGHISVKTYESSTTSQQNLWPEFTAVLTVEEKSSKEGEKMEKSGKNLENVTKDC